MEEVRRWEDMATDCLALVFLKLNLEDRTLGVPFVCKSWYQASLDPHCWRVLNFREIDLMPWSKFNARFAHEYRIPNFSFSGFMKFVIKRSRGSAVELAFPTVLGASFEDLVYASNECTRVKVLVLPNLLHKDEKNIPKVIGKWKNLEQLDIGLKSSSFAEILREVSQHCNKFVGLKMYGWFNNDDAKAIAANLPKLKSLLVTGSFLLKEQVMMIMDGCKDLETLEVTRCRGFDPDHDEIKNKAHGIKSFKCDGTKLNEAYWDECDAYADVWGMIY